MSPFSLSLSLSIYSVYLFFLPFFSLSFYFPHLSMTIIFTLTLPLSFCVCLSTFFHLLHISTSFDILLLSQSLSLTSVLIPIRRSRVHSFSFYVIAAAFYRLNNSKWFFDRSVLSWIRLLCSRFCFDVKVSESVTRIHIHYLLDTSAVLLFCNLLKSQIKASECVLRSNWCYRLII